MPEVTVHENVLPRVEFEQLRRASLSHPMISATTLNRRFEKTRGFALICREDGTSEALSTFPFLSPFFRLAGIGNQNATLENIHGFEEPVMRAYYVNLLLVSSGGDVGRHVDATLMTPMGVPDLTPSLVSVLHLQRPSMMIGGRLKIYGKTKKIASISPKENQLTRFQGDLPHAVGVVRTLSSMPRASLVCESYLAPVDAVMRLRPFSIVAKADFSVYLQLAESTLS